MATAQTKYQDKKHKEKILKITNQKNRGEKMKKFIFIINILFFFGCSTIVYDDGTSRANKIEKSYTDTGINNKPVPQTTFFYDGTNSKIVAKKEHNIKTTKKTIVIKKNPTKLKLNKNNSIIKKTAPKKIVKKIEANKKYSQKSSPTKTTLKNHPFYYPINNINISEDFSPENKGLTFKVDKNSSVFPAAKGMVIFSGNKSGIGKTLFIYHNDGYISIYYNLKTLNVAKGDYIKQLDQQIAYANSSFHFELRKQTKKGIKSLNPKKYLQKRRK